MKTIGCATACLSLLFCLPLPADTTSYQTASNPQPNTITQHEWKIPILSVDPATGKTRVYIQGDTPLNGELASRNAQVYHARALYSPTQQGIQTSIAELHQHMAKVCPTGWVKHQEWANLQTGSPELHYRFQCLALSQ